MTRARDAMAKPDPAVGPTPVSPPTGEESRPYEKLPAKTKELLLLQDQISESSGPESTELDKKARQKSRQAPPNRE
jgi:hypothetical protein